MRAWVLIAGLVATAAVPVVAAPFIAYRGDDEVMVYDLAADTHDNLTNHPSIDAGPSWSGDGRQIAFGSNRTGRWDLYTMRADGTKLLRRTHTGKGKWHATLSPDGRYIAYGVRIERPVLRRPIAVVDLRTGVQTVVTIGTGNGDESISWFPDSKPILFIRRGEGFGMYQVRVDGAMEEQLVFLSHDPALNPDGRRVANQWGGNGAAEIHIYDMETRTRTPIPIDLGWNRVPVVPTWLGPERLCMSSWLRVWSSTCTARRRLRGR